MLPDYKTVLESLRGVQVSPVSIVIADRHPLVLCGLMSVLGAESEFNVVASCCDGGTCMHAVRALTPDIALIDISMPGLSGLEILAAATYERLRTRILFLAASVEARELATAAARGAYGVIPKEMPPETLLQCLRQVAAGRKSLSLAFNGAGCQLGQGYPARNAESMLTVLTDRERQIVQLVSEGLPNKEVGRRLNLSDGTIKVHLHNIYQKLAINNRTTLAAWAVSVLF